MDKNEGTVLVVVAYGRAVLLSGYLPGFVEDEVMDLFPDKVGPDLTPGVYRFRVVLKEKYGEDMHGPCLEQVVALRDPQPVTEADWTSHTGGEWPDDYPLRSEGAEGLWYLDGRWQTNPGYPDEPEPV